jgi:vacuolar protein sorting-associated protein 41
MLDEVEDMRQSSKPDVADRLVFEAEGHVLSALLAWGTTRTLREHIKLFEYQANLDSSFSIMVHRTMESLQYRSKQSAIGYLDIASTASSETLSSEIHLLKSSDADDSLYSIHDLFVELSRRISIINFDDADTSNLMIMRLSTKERDSRVAMDAIAKLFMMKSRYDEALKCFLVLGAVHSVKTLEEIEEDALRLVNYGNQGGDEYVSPYSFILYLVENYHLHQYLLEANFLPEGVNCSPICALIRLVGLNLVGDFLIQNCTAPQQTAIFTSRAPIVHTGGERRGTLPLDLVADQLAGNPKLFHWYLHSVACRKPELYVKFPTTANPPQVISTLHKKHLDLYVRYAGPNKDSAQALAGVEAYLVAEKTTPLLSFLKVVLQLGTIGPVEVGKMLEIERRGGAGVSRTLALELAFLMENYGDNSESDALLILELCLKGAQSLMLAVSFAQRAQTHTIKLWEKLIEHCLVTSSNNKLSDGGVSGILFGSLLEAAALCGADLALLVDRIPKGMQVEGLRPRLVAAVADYRLKVQLHSKSTEIALDEKSLLFQEGARRSRRGMRFDCSTDTIKNIFDSFSATDTNIGRNPEVEHESPTMLKQSLRPRNRPNRYTHSFAVPIR